MTKRTEQKKNKKIILIVKTIIAIVVVVMLWCFYSLVRFDGIYSPIYVWGLSNPYKYYQKHIGSLLVKHGTEYKLKPTIDEQDSKTYNVYRDKEYHFEFKYPKEFKMSLDDNFVSSDIGTFIKFRNKSNSCFVRISLKGRGVGVNWIPRDLAILKKRILTNHEILYFYGQNKQVAYINNMSIPRSVDNAGIVYMSTKFIDKFDKKAIMVSASGNDCKNFAQTVFATFKFVR